MDLAEWKCPFLKDLIMGLSNFFPTVIVLLNDCLACTLCATVFLAAWRQITVKMTIIPSTSSFWIGTMTKDKAFRVFSFPLDSSVKIGILVYFSLVLHSTFLKCGKYSTGLR